jgi:glycine dehydrogenase
MIAELEAALCEITGYDAVSLQPNAGSQGEFAGLLAIRAYHRSRGDHERTVCLIPSSAHGTNAASAVMAGMQVVVVAATTRQRRPRRPAPVRRRRRRPARRDHGHLSVDPRRVRGRHRRAVRHRPRGRRPGLRRRRQPQRARRPRQAGRFGADVSHLNLHKTFCIPHGGGGPGVGPVAVRATSPRSCPAIRSVGRQPVGPVSAARYGSAGILPIPWVYIRLMGPEGLRRPPSTRSPRPTTWRASRRRVPGALHRRQRPCRPRVHPRHPADHQGHRRDGRRRREAPDRLRLPRADDELPRGGHPDDRADRERGPRRARPLLRRDAGDPARDRRRRRVAGGRARRHRRQPAAGTPRTPAETCSTAGTAPTPPPLGAFPDVGGCGRTSTSRRSHRIDGSLWRPPPRLQLANRSRRPRTSTSTATPVGGDVRLDERRARCRGRAPGRSCRR